MNKINLFNNEIELSLRIMILLKRFYPQSLDVEMLNYFDYFSLHTKDLGDKKSLHPDVPNRFGELAVKREIINKSLKLLLSKGLIEIVFKNSGIEYKASDLTSPFIDNLSEEYTLELIKKVNWVHQKFADFSYEQIVDYVKLNKNNWGSEISFCTIGLINE